MSYTGGACELHRRVWMVEAGGVCHWSQGLVVSARHFASCTLTRPRTSGSLGSDSRMEPLFVCLRSVCGAHCALLACRLAGVLSKLPES